MTTVRKRIILCSDGTGNSSSSLFKTNVWRLYQALDLSRPDQLAQYDDGVGTSSFKPLAILGGMFGIGLARNVRDLYAFVCRHYSPGDSIYGFGFSRGAFTIRVLSGLIASQGIVRYDNEADLQRKARRAYQDYRRRFQTRFGPTRLLHDGLRWSRDLLLDIKDKMVGFPPYERPEARIRRMKSLPDDPHARRELEVRVIEEAGNIPAQIEFLGVWDTVDAYGLPIDEMTRAVDDYFFPLTMRDRRLRLNVNYARHALALDDERNTFHPVLWREDGENDAKPATERRLLQVWFAGMHANVGGGYPVDSLSHVPLIWMIDQIDERKIGKAQGPQGLSFIETRVETYRQSADPLGPMADSRAGFGAYYRYQPRRFPLLEREAPPELFRDGIRTIKPHSARLLRGIQNRLSRKSLLRDMRQSGSVFSQQQTPQSGEDLIGERISINGSRSSLDLTASNPPSGLSNHPKPLMPELEQPILHHSVVDRLFVGVENYSPLIIPLGARVLNKRGRLADLDRYIQICKRHKRRQKGPQLTLPAKQQSHQDVIDNLVWYRRVLYFLTLFTTLFFAAAPFYLDTERTDGNDPTQVALHSAVVELVGGFLPGFVNPWIEAYAANPNWLVIMVVLLVILNLGGTWLKARINNSAGIAWRKAASGGRGAIEMSVLGDRLAKLRKHDYYRNFFRWLKGSALPAIFVLLFLLAGLAMVMQILFHLTVAPKSLVVSTAIEACRTTGEPSQVGASGVSARLPFDTRCQAWPSGLNLEGGMRYEIVLQALQPDAVTGKRCPGAGWWDKTYPADLFGLYAPEEASWLWHAKRHAIFGFFLPFRRHIDRPWFTLLAQVGGDGRAVAHLLPKKPPGRKSEERQTFISEFTAMRDGELFLYVNDVVNVFGMDFYNNNCGQAAVSLRMLDWDTSFNR